MSQIGNTAYDNPYGRNQLQDAMSAQNAASPAKPSEFELLKNQFAIALERLHEQAAAVEEIYTRIAGAFPEKTVSGAMGGAGPCTQTSGHLSTDIHKRIAATSEILDKLRALV